MLLGHWVKLEWLELMEMQTRATRIGFLETLAFPVVPVALAACHLPDACSCMFASSHKGFMAVGTSGGLGGEAWCGRGHAWAAGTDIYWAS